MFTPGKIMTLFAVSGACCFGMLWAQQDETGPATRETTVRDVIGTNNRNTKTVRTIGTTSTLLPAQEPDVVESVAEVRYAPGGQTIVHTRFGAQSDHGLSKALKAYRDSKPESTERKEARDKVAKGLSDSYDDQLKRQEQQIEELADRLDKLRVQLAKRRDAKARMVELKLEMVLSQAEGLGWPEDAGWLGSNPFGQQNLLFPTPPPMPALAPLSATPPATVLPATPVDTYSDAVDPVAPAAPAAPARATSPRR